MSTTTLNQGFGVLSGIQTSHGRIPYRGGCRIIRLVETNPISGDLAIHHNPVGDRVAGSSTRLIAMIAKTGPQSFNLTSRTGHD